MNTYTRGTAINLVQRFWTIDPLTEVAVLADPTDVVFTILAPDDVEQVFTFGTDTNVSNPAVGIYVCALDPQLPTGTYSYRCDGTGAVQASSEDMFDVIPSAVLTPDPAPVAQPGPCTSWINGDDVADCGDLGLGSDTWLLDDVAYAASSLLYDLSGRQFPGVCQWTVRPCQNDCGCWAGAASANWWWGSVGGWNGGGWGVGPTWVNDHGGTCGCGGNSIVRLPGYPVREILEVKIDGDVLPPDDPTTGAPNYRLDERRNLTRMWAPNGSNPGIQSWPCCQNLALNDDQPGTFSIKYSWGADVPPLGRMAAAQLARELWRACNGASCALPTKVTKVVRQGITVERVVPVAKMLRQGATGIQLVDAFIAQYNPTGMTRRPMVWTPDDQQYAKRVGQG